MKQAKAFVELEGFTISAEHDELVKAILSRKITEDEFQKMVDNLMNKGKTIIE